MNFFIKHIVLWLKDGSVRTLDFHPNKVNVITGASNTGKSAILSIIDYCFLASSSDIPEEKINERVDWYGMVFGIGNKVATVARESLTPNGAASPAVYFSSFGEIPIKPTANISFDSLKSFYQREFGLHDDLRVPYGGKTIKAGARWSYRYFLLFCTQSGDVIDAKNTYFDFAQHGEDRYKEAFDRVLPLVLGVDTEERAVLRVRLQAVLEKLARLERKQASAAQQSATFVSELESLVGSARSLGLMPPGQFDSDKDLETLKKLISGTRLSVADSGDGEQLELAIKKELATSRLKLRNIANTRNEIERYLVGRREEGDSLRLLDYVYENYAEVAETKGLGELLSALREQHQEVVRELNKRQPFAVDLTNEERELQQKIAVLQAKLDSLQTHRSMDATERGKLFFLGEANAKVEFYEKGWGAEDYSLQITSAESERRDLEEQMGNYTEAMRIAIDSLEDSIQVYLDKAIALENYHGYRAVFNTALRGLSLRATGTTALARVGSSSNYLFMHLALILGIHRHMLVNGVNFVPRFVILDQISRPYYETTQKSHPDFDFEDMSRARLQEDDRVKLVNALQLLETFIEDVASNQAVGQVILLEHVKEDVWKEAGLKHFHLVDEFRFGRKLVPEGLD